MSEEEILINIKEMINICDSLPNEECTAHIISHDHFKAVKGLLDLYNKLQNKIASLKKQIKLMQSCDLAKVIKEQEEKIQSLESQLDFIGEQNKYIDKIEKEFYRQKNDKRKMARAIKYLGTNFKITEDEIIKLFCEEGEAVTQDQLDKLSKEYISKDKIREIFNNKRNKIIFIRNRNERLDKVKILDEIEKELLKEN